MGIESIVPYMFTLGVPALILAFGAMIEDFKSTSMLAIVTVISFLSYYVQKEILPEWLLVLLFIVPVVMFVILFHSILSGGDE